MKAYIIQRAKLANQLFNGESGNNDQVYKQVREFHNKVTRQFLGGNTNTEEEDTTTTTLDNQDFHEAVYNYLVNSYNGEETTTDSDLTGAESEVWAFHSKVMSFLQNSF